MNALACVVAVPSSGSLMFKVSCVPATLVELDSRVGGVVSGACTMLADPKVEVLPTLSVTTTW